MVVADPVALAAVVATALAYGAGATRWRRPGGSAVVSRSQAAFFAAGLLTVAVALASPIDTRADRSLVDHMVQHVLLLSVAGPLLALGAPIPALFWWLPRDIRRRALAARRRLLAVHDRHFVAWVAATLTIAAAVTWIWHLPAAYEGAVRNPALHAVEHLSFLLVSTASWWSVVTGRRSWRGAAAIAGLLGSVPGMLLGTFMVLAPNPWYPLYSTAGRAAALSQQQVAGVVMWAFGGMATVIVGAGLFASWMAAGADPPAATPVPPMPVRAGAVS